MTKESVLLDLENAIVAGDEDKAREATKAALAAGVKPVEIMQEGVARGMARIGDLFQNFEVFLPELMLAGEAGKVALDIVIPTLKSGDRDSISRGKVVIGTAVGDMHDIGKNLVGAVLAASGFEVYDLGVNVSPMAFVRKAQEVGANIIGMSSLLTTSLPYQKDVVNYLNDIGIRDKYFVIVGGGPVTPEWAVECRVDGYARLAPEAVELCEQLVDGKVSPPLAKPIVIGAQTAD
jgi:methylmalonyl-CoA mutase cobalamin-binding domain/chain